MAEGTLHGRNESIIMIWKEASILMNAVLAWVHTKRTWTKIEIGYSAVVDGGFTKTV